MLKVGITGGIGSGKSTVCQVFNTLGIPIFYADDAAKYLMDNDILLTNSIKQLFGEGIYQNGKLDRIKVASVVFKEPQKLHQLNALVHPATINYGRQWVEKQTSRYIIKEAAIFFESGSYKEMDVMVGVYAPPELRIKRTIERTHNSRESIMRRIANQMDEDEKMKRCDYVIVNDETKAIIPQIITLHQNFLQKATQ
ncbi:MAG TPA: dephospho-CoA kinase [Flavipsychrobacter sp.]|nr:dephospho-CoA kinase [Flavipsychrobacter sp.]